MPVSMVFPKNSFLRHIFNHYIFKGPYLNDVYTERGEGVTHKQM